MPTINSYTSLITINMKMRLLVFNISNYLWVQNAAEVMLRSWCWWSWVVLGHQNQGGQIWELTGERRQNLSGLVFFLFWFSFLMSVVFYAIPPPNAAKKKPKPKPKKQREGASAPDAAYAVVLSVNIQMYLEGCSAHSHYIVLILTFGNSLTLVKEHFNSS